jgi:hypothetical protein
MSNDKTYTQTYFKAPPRTPFSELSEEEREACYLDIGTYGQCVTKVTQTDEGEKIRRVTPEEWHDESDIVTQEAWDKLKPEKEK